MKKNIIGLMLFTLLGSSSFAFSQKVKSQHIETDYTEVIILDKGIKRTMLIPKDNARKSKITPYAAEQSNAKEGIIVSFSNDKQVSIDNFETKYGLKLQEKLVIGYYIFQNISKYSDVQVIKNIITNETNIKTVKPNWKKKNTPR